GKYSCDCRNIIAIITAGFDWTQCEDGPVEEIRAGRRDLVPAESASLARPHADDIDDSYRHPGGTRWEERKLDGKGHRRAVSGRSSQARQLKSYLAELCPGMPKSQRGNFVCDGRSRFLSDKVLKTLD